MSGAEKTAFINARGRGILARHGLSSRTVNLSGQGKLKPRQPVTQPWVSLIRPRKGIGGVKQRDLTMFFTLF
jgi:hypothetical protein